MGTVRSCTGVNDALIGFEDLCKSVTGLCLKSPNESSTRLRNPVSCTSMLLPYKVLQTNQNIILQTESIQPPGIA